MAALTVLLWWSYISVHLQLDNAPLDQILEETVRNERALLIYAIIATVMTVSNLLCDIHLILFFNIIIFFSSFF